MKEQILALLFEFPSSDPTALTDGFILGQGGGRGGKFAFTYI
jgi:hypothetical protein